MDTDLVCLCCDGNKFTPMHKKFVARLDGQHIEAWAYAMICDNCGDSIMTTEQMNLFRNECKLIQKGVMVNELPEDK